MIDQRVKFRDNLDLILQGPGCSGRDFLTRSSLAFGFGQIYAQ